MKPLKYKILSFNLLYENIKIIFYILKQLVIINKNIYFNLFNFNNLYKY